MAEPYTPTEMELRQAWVSRQAINGELTEASIIRGQDEFDRFMSGYVRKPSREELLAVLNSAEHAPPNTHSPVDGSCQECPWPVHHLGPDVIADAILALLERTDQ